MPARPAAPCRTVRPRPRGPRPSRLRWSDAGTRGSWRDGAAPGLANADVNGNFSHNDFASTGGMNPVDLFNGDRQTPLTLAYTGRIGDTGVVPEPGSLALLAAGLAGLAGRRRGR